MDKNYNLENAGVLIVDWLKKKGDLEAVKEPMKCWLKRHSFKPEARSVYQYWLYEGGDKSLVKDSIGKWLVENRSRQTGRHVFCAWLNNGGDKSLVKDSIGEWLVKYQCRHYAGLVFCAWLNSGGDKALIEKAMEVWLEHYGDTFKAFVVYNSWLNAYGDKVAIQRPMKLWLNEHYASSKVIEMFIKLHYLYKGSDDEKGLSSKKTIWLMYSYWLRNLVDTSFLPVDNKYIQSPGIIHLLNGALKSGDIDLVNDQGNIDVLFEWVNCWFPDRKATVKDDFDLLRNDYGIGGQVQFEIICRDIS